LLAGEQTLDSLGSLLGTPTPQVGSLGEVLESLLRLPSASALVAELLLQLSVLLVVGH
jgi:hypothetical protein